MATISNNDIAKSIYLLTKGKSGADLDQTLGNVTKFLARKRLLSKSSAILSRLKKMINEGDGILEVKLSSAEELGGEAKRELKQILTERYKVKEVNFTEVLDKSLLGGMRIEAGDEVLDLTIKNKIAKLKEYLTR